VGAEDGEFDASPGTEGEADDGDGAELELLDQIGVVPGVVVDVADLFEAFGIGKAGMGGEIDGEVLGQELVEGHPLGFAAGGMEIEQGRALATDGELGFLAGDGGEGGGGFGHGG
jgi:hypothetical protein